LLSIKAKPPWREMSTFSDEQSAQGKVYVIDLDPVGIGVQVIHHRFDEDRGDASEVLERAILIHFLELEAGAVPIHQVLSSEE
jgi:hypothetical protein